MQKGNCVYSFKILIKSFVLKKCALFPFLYLFTIFNRLINEGANTNLYWLKRTKNIVKVAVHDENDCESDIEMIFVSPASQAFLEDIGMLLINKQNHFAIFFSYLFLIYVIDLILIAYKQRVMKYPRPIILLNLFCSLYLDYIKRVNRIYY